MSSSSLPFVNVYSVDGSSTTLHHHSTTTEEESWVVSLGSSDKSVEGHRGWEDDDDTVG